MRAGWGELRVGPGRTLTQTVPGLAGEVGCVRGQAFPCTEGATGLSRRIFQKRKRPLVALWGIPLQQQLQSPLHPATHPSREHVHPPGSVCTSSQRELRPQEPGRVQIKEGSAHTHIAQRRPTIKKEGVVAGNPRIPPGRGNPPTKE